ncbi:MAG: hypothetical protein LBC68_12395 [Prevotellaceae bacterium]|jgi:hypothetical protein|nr:hypothetical protein [Prevotellaceae bacterium]
MTKLKSYLLILAISASYISCNNLADIEAFPKENQEYTELMKFCNNPAVNILESKKAGDQIFAKYQNDTLTGLISVFKDSIVFINDTFFTTEMTEYQQFDFIDSLKIKFTANQTSENETVNYRYIFRFDDSSSKWLLEYAEKKEITAGQSIYYFTDNVQQNFSLENFSLKQSPSILFTNTNSRLFSYKYKENKYLDSVEIQVNRMKLANVSSFGNIFTIDHAEEILRDYPVNKITVLSLNNISYYLEQMSIAIPAIAILETIIDNNPDRIVSYINLSDALAKNNLKVKAEKIRKQYDKLKLKN